MENNKDVFANLFKEEFQNNTESLSLSEQYQLEKLVRKQAFWSFSPYTFNMYYALAIVSGFLLSTTLGVHYIYNYVYQNPYQYYAIEQKAILPNDSITVNNNTEQHFSNTTTRTNNNKPLIPSVKNTILQTGNQSNADKTIDSSIVNSPKIEPIISAKPNLEPEEIKPMKKDSIKPIRKTIYITKRDTIFQLDTLKNKPKRKK
jgi:hypothetical protein